MIICILWFWGHGKQFYYCGQLVSLPLLESHEIVITFVSLFVCVRLQATRLSLMLTVIRFKSMSFFSSFAFNERLGVYLIFSTCLLSMIVCYCLDIEIK